ncbi:unnamed protein product [Amoebophrya sp. A120]|nr:unnamed protein product [Amoebophrya sp. A120]|eukprot:GSA120T00008414001.1
MSIDTPLKQCLYYRLRKGLQLVAKESYKPPHLRADRFRLREFCQAEYHFFQNPWEYVYPRMTESGTARLQIGFGTREKNEDILTKDETGARALPVKSRKFFQKIKPAAGTATTSTAPSSKAPAAAFVELTTTSTCSSQIDKIWAGIAQRFIDQAAAGAGGRELENAASTTSSAPKNSRITAVAAASSTETTGATRREITSYPLVSWFKGHNYAAINPNKRTNYKQGLPEGARSRQALLNPIHFTKEMEYAACGYLIRQLFELFEKFNVVYFISSGSLIGPERHGMLIPHDHDFDLTIPASSRDKAMEVLALLEQREYERREKGRRRVRQVEAAGQHLDLRKTEDFLAAVDAGMMTTCKWKGSLVQVRSTFYNGLHSELFYVDIFWGYDVPMIGTYFVNQPKILLTTAASTSSPSSSASQSSAALLVAGRSSNIQHQIKNAAALRTRTTTTQVRGRSLFRGEHGKKDKEMLKSHDDSVEQPREDHHDVCLAQNTGPAIDPTGPYLAHASPVNFFPQKPGVFPLRLTKLEYLKHKVDTADAAASAQKEDANKVQPTQFMLDDPGFLYVRRPLTAEVVDAEHMPGSASSRWWKKRCPQSQERCSKPGECKNKNSGVKKDDSCKGVYYDQKIENWTSLDGDYKKQLLGQWSSPKSPALHPVGGHGDQKNRNKAGDTPFTKLLSLPLAEFLHLFLEADQKEIRKIAEVIDVTVQVHLTAQFLRVNDEDKLLKFSVDQAYDCAAVQQLASDSRRGRTSSISTSGASKTKTTPPPLGGALNKHNLMNCAVYLEVISNPEGDTPILSGKIRKDLIEKRMRWVWEQDVLEEETPLFLENFQRMREKQKNFSVARTTSSTGSSSSSHLPEDSRTSRNKNVDLSVYKAFGVMGVFLACVTGCIVLFVQRKWWQARTSARALE